MAERREQYTAPRWQERWADYFEWKGKEAAEMRREEEAKIAKRLAGSSFSGKLLGNNLIGAAAAGLLLGTVYYGDKMHNYGKKEWKAIPGHFRKLVNVGT